MSEQTERAIERAAADAARGLRVAWIDIDLPTAQRVVAAIARSPLTADAIARSVKGKVVCYSGGTITAYSVKGATSAMRGRAFDRVYAPREQVTSPAWRELVAPAFLGRKPRFIAID